MTLDEISFSISGAKAVSISVRSDGYFICSGCIDTYWCDHLVEFFTGQYDAALLRADMTYMVPILPKAGVFAPVIIDPLSPEFGSSALMCLSWTPDLGKVKNINLGFWNPGDSCRTIRSIILDWIKSQLEPTERWDTTGSIVTKCPSTSHGFNAERRMDEKANVDAQWKLKCLWDIILEGACTICIEDAGDPSVAVPVF